MKINETYTGPDATLEILIMLLVAFLLGWVLRWLYDKYLFEYIEEEDDEVKVTENKIIQKEVFEVIPEEEVNFSENKEDDLKLIEGVGPKIEGLLKAADINTFEKLSGVTAEYIRNVLKERGGERYAFHDPSTWPDQAKLASEGRMEELKEYQDFLSGGRA